MQNKTVKIFPRKQYIAELKIISEFNVALEKSSCLSKNQFSLSKSKILHCLHYKKNLQRDQENLLDTLLGYPNPSIKAMSTLYNFLRQSLDNSATTTGLIKWTKDFPHLFIDTLITLCLSLGTIRVKRYCEKMLRLFHHSCICPHCSHLMSLSSPSCCPKFGHPDADFAPCFLVLPQG